MRPSSDAALPEELRAALRLLPEHDDVVEFRLLDAAVGREGERGDRAAVGEGSEVRIAGEVAEQKHFVELHMA
jgi:hypothetical protein